MYEWSWGVLFSSTFLTGIAYGLFYTLIVSALSLLVGTVLGLVTAILAVWGSRPVRVVSRIYVDFFRTTPFLVQLVWIFYVLPILMGISLSALEAGIVALGLNSGAFLSEIFRGGLVSIARGQHDAAHVLGFSRVQTLRYIIVPQALRRVLPSVANVFISMLKDSSLLSVVAVPELTYQAMQEVARTYRPLELYTGLAVVYFLVTYPLSLGASFLERRFRVT